MPPEKKNCCVVSVTYVERYYGIIIDIYGLTIEQVSILLLYYSLITVTKLDFYFLWF